MSPQAPYLSGTAPSLTSVEPSPPPYPVVDPEPSFVSVVKNVNQPKGWFHIAAGTVVGGLVGVRAGQYHLRYGFANHIRKHWYAGMVFGAYAGFSWAVVESERRLRGQQENEVETRAMGHLHAHH